MARVRWEPIREINSIQNEVNRLFNTFFDTPVGATEAGARRWVPAMDLVDAKDHFLLRADLPGMSQEDVTIEIDDRVLTVSGEREADVEVDRQGYHRLERAYGTFSRSLTLPEGVDPEGVSARFDRGVLEVAIPKPEQRKPRRITIDAAEAPAIEGKESADAGSVVEPAVGAR